MGKQPKRTPIAEKIYSILREEDKIIGHLTDFKVKWLVGFCQYLFETEKCQIGVDLHSSPKRIFLVPLWDQEGEWVSLPVKTWNKMFKLKKANVHERDLPDHVGLEGFVVKFVRKIPKGDSYAN